MASYSEKMAIIARHQRVPPVQTIPIARDLGLEVFRVRGWPDSVSAMIKRDGKSPSGYSIYVNADHAETRRRFSIAHEIGHFVLHEDRIGDGITDDGLYRSKLGGPLEAQANRFASNLLVPQHLLQAALATGISTVEDLAEHFQISRSSMSIRLGVPYEEYA